MVFTSYVIVELGVRYRLIVDVIKEQLVVKYVFNRARE